MPRKLAALPHKELLTMICFYNHPLGVWDDTGSDLPLLEGKESKCHGSQLYLPGLGQDLLRTAHRDPPAQALGFLGVAEVWTGTCQRI